ncbi:LOB domain-containing protein 4-like [Rhododendron vialii]|uniref:LOB domain-containing protein 4-like n=1 Tax=Rhododendron vialii TaxID=182163 RepID=UPI0026605AAD|nr:LOB domain-containing protein 4-like [Rhododendron vialii]
MESAAARIKMPCAACRILRWRCMKDCILLPHFPPIEPEKFVAVHRVFGASNVCKMLQEIPIADREDAVTSMVYEAKARLADPVYGCVAFVASLQRQVSHLQSELNAALAEAMVLRAQLLEALSTCLIHSQPQDAARISKQRDLEA